MCRLRSPATCGLQGRGLIVICSSASRPGRSQRDCNGAHLGDTFPVSRIWPVDDVGDVVRKGFACILCGSVLSACSGGIPGLGGEAVKVSLQSTPPGANASLSSGGSCKTPCTLPAPDKAGDYNVTFGLAGYAPLSMPVHVSMNKESWYSFEKATVEPNPVTAVLQTTTPPPQAKKR